MVSCNTSAQSLEKKSLLFPQTKITILITMVVLWCSHSAAGRTRLRWHRPLGMGTRSGPASREITGWCGGGGGWGELKLKPASAPSCQPRELLFAASWLLSVSSSPSGDNWRCTLCKHVFYVSKLSFIVSDTRPVYLHSMQKIFFF